MRPVRLSAFTGLLLLAVLTSPSKAAETRHFEDAALNAVQFVDKNEGWAVGDEGVIWHTIDGGKTWERQATGLRGSLRSLHFLNPYSGWVVGREELPGGGSAGVILTTQDGGLEWKRVLPGSMAGLQWVHFLDDKLGYMAGDGTDAAPSGVFVTKDGGRTWQPVPGKRGASWLGGTCAVDKAGNCKVALGGAWSRLANARPDRITAANVDQLGGRAVRGLHSFNDWRVAVGQGGLLLMGKDEVDARWGYPELPIDDQACKSWDFHAVHGVGQRLWIVGRPGSVVLHTQDGGVHWEVQMTKQPLPLNGVFFIDEQRGFAVGELGTILGTTDGGKSWQVRQQGGKRCPALLVNAHLDRVPLDAVAMIGGDEGYLTAVLGVASADPASAAPVHSVDHARLAAAVREAGGAAGETLWPFPMASHLSGANRDEVLHAWDMLHGGRTADQMQRQLVLALRVWRPNVVLTDNPTLPGAEPIIVDAVRSACEKAGDPKIFPEQCSILGLAPWRPTKVYACSDGQGHGEVTLDLSTPSLRLEATPREFATSAMALLSDRPARLPPVRHFRLIAGPESAANDMHLMQGVQPKAEEMARRILLDDAGNLMDWLRQEIAAREVMREMQQQTRVRTLTEAAPTLVDPNQLIGQLEPMLKGLSDDHAAKAIHAIAGQFVRTGQWGLARETYLMMADRYPAHPLTADALRWLIRHSASAEARRHEELHHYILHAIETFGSPAGTLPSEPTKPGQPAANIPRMENTRQQGVALLSNPEALMEWYKGALALEPRLAGFGPLYDQDPSIQFCLQSVRRSLGKFEEARAWYRQFADRQLDGPWKNAALAELWLTERSGVCPKPVAKCFLADTRPFLDGKLDDPCWKASQILPLVNASGNTATECPTEVHLTYDREYLYISARCFHAGGRNVTVSHQRSHDADLSGHDRLSILLDLDRDYSTWYHLQVDERGLVAEDCWGDKKWDPKWFVAVRHETRCWIVEAAIPLAELTGQGIPPGHAWAFNAIRTLPGKGVQAWSLPAEVPEEAIRPEGFGLLLFSQAQGPQAAVANPAPMNRPANAAETNGGR